MDRRADGNRIYVDRSVVDTLLHSSPDVVELFIVVLADGVVARVVRIHLIIINEETGRRVKD